MGYTAARSFLDRIRIENNISVRIAQARAISPEEALLKEGWKRQTTIGEPRLSEIVANYKAMGFVVAALIVGSSIVMTVPGGPTLLGLPAFGLIGFVGAGNYAYFGWSVAFGYMSDPAGAGPWGAGDGGLADGGQSAAERGVAERRQAQAFLEPARFAAARARQLRFL